ncbi:MAG: hypothetical protein KQJ78_21480 [Deltaproteobacteria bacterium]|nr:hypothetical protein [Deltaproteobacteria bacterium]
MAASEIPLERLQYFLGKLGLDDEALVSLEPYRQAFSQKGPAFGREFAEYFRQIDATRVILEMEDPPGALEKTLGHWFESLFRDTFGPFFLGKLWRSGAIHVQVGVDQRYVNLGYALARDFCHRVARQVVPAAERYEVVTAVDKMLDFCVLVATDSFLGNTAKCDMEVVAGIAHQVRNPITVIGGNLLRLKKELATEDGHAERFERIMLENRRLERMVRDIAAYSKVFEQDPKLVPINLGGLLADVLRGILAEHPDLTPQTSLDLAPDASRVLGDGQQLEIMFYYLLENCLEALDPADLRLSITARRPPTSRYVEVTIFNTGTPPPPEIKEKLFTPFHSSKPLGTGFGLPIAGVVARRHMGKVILRASSPGGTITQILLPGAD